MLHNMDRFFDSLLEQQFYGDLLKDHLEGYVQEIIHRKYHILKTSDNFYIYKSDIKQWIRQMQQDYDWMQRIAQREGNTGMIGQPASQKDIDIEEGVIYLMYLTYSDDYDFLDHLSVYFDFSLNIIL